jgi:Protein of unknown function (DUF2889)
MPLPPSVPREFLTRRTVTCEGYSRADGAPYPTCRDITPHTQRLVGLKIVGGFKREMRARIGNTEGCTHIVALRDRGTREQLSTFNVRDPSRPALLDTCHSYAADSPIIARLWPMHYRPRK